MASARKRWLTDGLNLRIDSREHSSENAVPPPVATAKSRKELCVSLPILDSESVKSSPIDFPPLVPADYRSAADSVVYQGPPPVADDDELAEQTVTAFPTLGQLDIDSVRKELGGRQRSASLVGSVLVHAAIVLLIAFMVVPADLGGLMTHTIIISLSDEAPEIPIPMVLVDQISAEDSSFLNEVDMEPEPIVPVEVKFDIGQPTIQIGGATTKPGKSSSNVSGGARGSFFGIEAAGQDFVYIVDRSGSMNGVRYRRAIDELIRSVRELRSDQRFFVVLFSTSNRIMFDGSAGHRGLVEATEENKKRLEKWLATISAGGGTNPNSSLRVAMKMQPSAIFMLSDGEFTESKTSRRGKLLQGGGDAYSIVEAAGGTIPIHAIAFEDPRSCQNMQRLSKMTGGEYRFVNSAGKTQAELVADLKKLMSEQTSDSRLLRQNRLAHQIGTAPVDNNTKLLLAHTLVEDFETKFGKVENAPSTETGNQRMLATRDLLRSLVAGDPNRAAYAKIQDKFSGELSRLMSINANKTLIKKTCDEIVQWPRSDATTKTLDRLSDHFAAIQNETPDEAFERYRNIKMLHGRSAIVAVCRDTCDQYTSQIIAEADTHLLSGDLESAIKKLRQFQSGQTNGILRSETWKVLRDLTMKQLAAARDASLRHDSQTKADINEQLASGFENDPQLSHWRKEFSSRELNARRMLQRVTDNHSYAGLMLQRKELEAIVKAFPDTVAAARATEALKKLPEWQAEQEKEEAELIRMMDDSRRR